MAEWDTATEEVDAEEVDTEEVGTDVVAAAEVAAAEGVAMAMEEATGVMAATRAAAVPTGEAAAAAAEEEVVAVMGREAVVDEWVGEGEKEADRYTGGRRRRNFHNSGQGTSRLLPLHFRRILTNVTHQDDQCVRICST